MDFRGSIAWLDGSLSTLRREGSPQPHARLASDCATTLYRVGFAPTGPAMKSFSFVFSSHCVLLSRASLGAIPFSGLLLHQGFPRSATRPTRPLEAHVLNCGVLPLIVAERTPTIHAPPQRFQFRCRLGFVILVFVKQRLPTDATVQNVVHPSSRSNCEPDAACQQSTSASRKGQWFGNSKTLERRFETCPVFGSAR